MKNYLDLNALQMDALREISNIGAGNAATSLSLMLNRKIDMAVPKVNISTFAEAVEIMGGAESEVAGGYMVVKGETPMGILFLISKDQLEYFLNMLFGTSNVTTNYEFNEIQSSAFLEVVNILAGSYLNALAAFTHCVFMPSVPALAVDMAGALLGEVLQRIGEVSDYTLVIENIFFEEEKQLKGHFLFLPEPKTLEILLNALGVL
ncbi:MAG: chemotaxis protein CheC [Clostridia bacterium]|nr:chemotaxis protein CheC [Clostridia bacterium]MDD4047603.1 chemotaxis protein CheC [Clostridia bacterium]